MGDGDGAVCPGAGAKSAPGRCPEAANEFSEGEVFLLYRQLGDLRRHMRSLVSGRGVEEPSVAPEVDRRLVVFGGPRPAPVWNGVRLTRQAIRYPARRWSEDRAALVQEKLYALSEAFGDYLLEELGVDRERVTDFEAIVESFGDWLLTGYLMTPPEVAPGHQAPRRFLGNFYPRAFLDATLDTVYLGLTALPAYYAWLTRLGLATRPTAEAVLSQCSDWPWYRRRFEEYETLSRAGRARWRREYDSEAMPVG
jgi:hypothetical protein